MGIENPVLVRQVGGVSGGYHGQDASGSHHISIVGWLKPEAASKQVWHELAHARQAEEGETFGAGYHDAYEQGHDTYINHPTEVEARQWAERHPFPVARPLSREASIKVQEQQGRGFIDPALEAMERRAFWYDDTNEVIYLSKPGGIHTDLLNEFDLPLGQGWRGVVSPAGVEWIGARGVFSPEETKAVQVALQPHLDYTINESHQPPAQEDHWSF